MAPDACAPRLLEGASLRFRQRAGIGKGRQPANPRHGFDQNFLSLAIKLSGEDAEPRCIAVWPSERFHQSLPDQIVGERKDRNRFGRLLYGTNCHAPARIDDIGLGFDQLRRILRNQIDVRCKSAVINREVLALNETAASQFLEKSHVYRHIARKGRQDT